MAAAIPEAVGAAASAGEAAAGTGEATAARHARRTRLPAAREKDIAAQQAARDQRQSGRRARMQAPAAPRQQRQGTPPRGGSQRQRQFKQAAKKTGRGALKARLPGSHSYQPVILAEFVVAVVVVATGPLAKGGTPEAQTKGSPSPYSVNTLKQLVAIGGVYFVLALLASSRRAGRMAAWFGGLVLVGLGLAEYLSGDLQAIFGVFGPSSGTGSAAAAGQLAQLPAGFLPEPSNAVVPTPTGQPGQAQQLTTQSVTFTQPGYATTTETSPGVTVT
jgi:hypothetical protein